MPLLVTAMLNARFRSRDDGAIYDTAEDALAKAIQAAVALAADELLSGERSCAIEIGIEDGDGEPLLRSVVAVSVSPLLIDRAEGTPPS